MTGQIQEQKGNYRRASGGTDNFRWRLSSKGFTLIEIAIVIVILGTLVSLGAGLIGPLTLRAKTIESKETINAAADSVNGFAVTAPQAALPTLAQFQATVRTPNDAWGKPVQYIFDNGLTGTPSPLVCTRTTTNITVRICNNAACTAPSTVTNVAFLVLSGSANTNNQTAGSQAVAAPTTISTYASGVAVDNYGGDFIRAADEYDDIVKWVTLPELQTKLSCQRCSAYEIYNNLPALPTVYFQVNGMGCSQVAVNTLISSIGPGGSIKGFQDGSCSVPAAVPLITCTQASVTDGSGNKNCAVNYNNTDR